MRKYSLSLVFTMLISVCLLNAQQKETATSFKPGALWLDDRGEHINAHGGGVLYYEGKYYWFGEHKTSGRGGNKAMVGVGCYSSTDLYNWKNEGVALEVEKEEISSEIVQGSVIERPKVVYNAMTKKFVMWFHLELKDQGYNAARTGLAVSDSPTGPFTYLRSFRPNARQWPLNFQEDWKNKKITESDLQWWTAEWRKEVEEGLLIRRDFEKGQMSRDMTVFVDDDGKAYHIHAAEENLSLHISELTNDYLSFTGKWSVVAPGGHNEAPSIFKQNGKYFMIASGCTGWDPNAARSFVAESIWGPWTPLGNPCVGEGADITFESQSTFILPVAGKKDAFIFMADRWRPRNPIDGRYVWLPISLETGKPVLKWYDEWTLEKFNKAQ